MYLKKTVETRFISVRASHLSENIGLVVGKAWVLSLLCFEVTVDST